MGEFKKANHYLELKFDTLEVFPCELEKVEGYDGFCDVCETFEMIDISNQRVVGEFKGNISVYDLPENPECELPEKCFDNYCFGAEECMIRVYIIEALNLQPKDPNGLVILFYVELI